MTVEKLEKALNQLANESQHTEDTESGWDCEKENVQQKVHEETEMHQSDDDMEITTMATLSNGNQIEGAVEQIDMEVSASSLVPMHDDVTLVGDSSKFTEELPTSTIPCKHFSSEQTLESPCIEEIEMAAVEEDKVEQEGTVKTVESISTSTVPEEIIIEAPEKSCSDQEVKFSKGSLLEVKGTMIQDFTSEESSEFVGLAKKFKWKIEVLENEIFLSKIHHYITVKLKLEYEYNHQNVKHYIVEDIEVDTKKGF